LAEQSEKGNQGAIMQELKPSHWLHKDGSVISDEHKKLKESLSSIQAAMVSGYGTQLYALPKTHRIVSVELLEQIAVRSPTTGLTWDRKLRAIIDKEPTK
jgi:hypothetical protein